MRVSREREKLITRNHAKQPVSLLVKPSINVFFFFSDPRDPALAKERRRNSRTLGEVAYEM